MSNQSDNFFIHVGGMASLFALMRSSRLSTTAFAVGAALCTFADRDGACWPKREEICNRLGIARVPTISAALAELTEAGFVSSSKGQRGNQYRLNLEPTYTMIAPAVSETVTAENPCCNGNRNGRDFAGTESDTAEKSCRNAFRIPAVTESVTTYTLDQSNNETIETTPSKITPKPKKTTSPEIAEAAERIVALYAATVKPKSLDKSGSRKLFLSTATRLLAAGHSEDYLSRAIRNYAASAKQTERRPDDIKFRYGFQTFFGPKFEHWRDYIAEVFEEPAGEYVDDYNSPTLVAMILEGIERERQGLEVI